MEAKISSGVHPHDQLNDIKTLKRHVAFSSIAVQRKEIIHSKKNVAPLLVLMHRFSFFEHWVGGGMTFQTFFYNTTEEVEVQFFKSGGCSRRQQGCYYRGGSIPYKVFTNSSLHQYCMKICFFVQSPRTFDVGHLLISHSRGKKKKRKHRASLQRIICVRFLFCI